jgi:hypothetical protein
MTYLKTRALTPRVRTPLLVTKILSLEGQSTTEVTPMHKKRVNFASTSSTVAHKQLTPHPHAYQPWSLDGHLEDDYTEYDDGDEYSEHPWNLQENEESFPKQQFIPPPIPTPNPTPNP